MCPPSPGSEDAQPPIPTVAVASDEDVENAIHLARLLSASFATVADTLPTLPREHALSMIQSLENLAFPAQDRVARARLALLVCIDAVAGERRVGTGLGEMIGRHFPDCGSSRDRGILDDRRSADFRRFAIDWLNWLQSGPPADIRRHMTLAVAPILVEGAMRRELRGAGAPRSTTSPWVATVDDAAFAIVATYAVSHPRHAAMAFAIRDKVSAALESWEAGRKGRWAATSELTHAIRLGMSAESLRSQWNDHERDRETEIVNVGEAVPPASR
jgi:hypothetical protein